MPKTWIVAVALAGLLAGCTDSEQTKKLAAAEAQKVEWTWLESAKQDLDAKRQQLAGLEAQAATGADVAAQVDAVHQEVDKAEDALGARLAAYINADPPVMGEPLSPQQMAAARMKSAEDMVIAQEFIALGGDYRKAIDIYNAALTLDPDNGALKAALAAAESNRYMSAGRFAQIKKGMTQDQVRAALGVPLARNMKEYPEKKVSAWFYPTNESGDAAGVWFNDKKVAYQVTYDAVKAQSAGN
ncbi:MAG: outer membrane protein assembly factor BamE [Thermoanaerobaculia bacterium]|nr:outer membrane protein assembly factor BamE [Thermoanaerobaculia bacterium]